MNIFKKFWLLLLLAPVFLNAQQEKIVALEQLLAATKTDTDHIKALGDLAWEWKGQDIEKAKSYSAQELAMAEKLGNQKFLAMAYNDRGTIEFLLGNFEETNKLWAAALVIRKKLNDPAGIASSTGKMGNLYTKLGQYDKALQAQLECLKYSETAGNKLNVALTQGNIGSLYCELWNAPKAKEYARLALKTSQELGSQQGTQNSLSILARAYLQQHENDSALILYRQAYIISETINDRVAQAVICNNIGNVFDQKQQTDSALHYYVHALHLSEAIQNKSSICRNANAAATAYLKLAQPDLAAPLLEKAFSIATAIGQKPIIYSASASLAEYYRQKGNYQKSMEYLESYINIKDSIYIEKSATAIAEMQTKYETEKKEQELQIQKLKVIRKNSLLAVVLGLFLLSAVLGYLFYNRYKLKQQALFQEMELKQQEVRTKAVLEAEERERQRIGQDLHDGVGQTLSALKLNLSNLWTHGTFPEPLQKDMVHNAMDLADESVKEVRTISHNMMPNVLMKAGLARAVREFISKINSERLKIDLEISGLDARLDSTVETVLFRVLQELVNNIIKHANANHITIQLLHFENEITLLVEDNGIGFNTTALEQSDSGIGIKNIRSRVEFLKGQVHFDSSIGRGTTVSVVVPVPKP